jgi:hypothetical protein
VNGLDVMRQDLMSEGTSRYITEAHARHGGGQIIYRFPNGYGASVIRHAYSYGGTAGLFELGVLDDKGLCYDTPVTEDVEGRLSPPDVDRLLLQIKNLPARVKS